jgi:hypothetical protein
VIPSGYSQEKKYTKKRRKKAKEKPVKACPKNYSVSGGVEGRFKNCKILFLNKEIFHFWRDFPFCMDCPVSLNFVAG